MLRKHLFRPSADDIELIDYQMYKLQLADDNEQSKMQSAEKRSKKSPISHEKALRKKIKRGQYESITEEDLKKYPFIIHHALSLRWDHEKLEKLLQLGASVNYVNERGMTPLCFCLILRLDTKRVNILIKYGASTDFLLYNKYSLLHVAIRSKCHVDTVEKLLQCGISVNAVDFNGFRPLILALKENSEDIALIHKLLQFDAELDGWFYLLRNFQLFSCNEQLEISDYGDENVISMHPLTFALRFKLNVAVTKLLTKYTAKSRKPIEYCEEYVEKLFLIMRLDNIGGEYIRFARRCFAELRRMPGSLYDFLLGKEEERSTMKKDEVLMSSIIYQFVVDRYPIYHDTITYQLGREYLKEKLERTVRSLGWRLNHECLYQIFDELTDMDIIVAIAAFDI